jgi:hypothetical protein
VARRQRDSASRWQLGDGAAAAAAAVRQQQRGSCGGDGSTKDVGGSLAAARQRDSAT